MQPVDVLIADEKSRVEAITGLPKKFQAAYFSNPAVIETEPWRYMRDVFPETGRQNALLCGSTGVGKTWAAVAYVGRFGVRQYEHKALPSGLNALELAEARSNPDSGRITRYVDVLRQESLYLPAYDAAQSLNDKEAKLMFRRSETVPVLIVDDIGTVPPGFKQADFFAWLENIIRKRANAGLVTIGTTNMSWDRFEQAAGKRIVSELHQSGKVKEFTGVDLRRAQA